MNKQTEALKLALEALKLAMPDLHGYWKEKAEEAGLAIREALVDSALERMAENAREIGLDYGPAQQQQEPVALPEKIYEFVPTPEPVKWHHPECEGQCIACLIEQVVQEAYGSQGLGYLQRHLTSPPQRKPLTDEDLRKLADKHLFYQSEGYEVSGVFTLARAIEAKLREKNA